MSIIVQKFGGSSVSNKENLEKVIEKIIKYKKQNHKLVVVVSAQGKTTDSLIKLANTYSNKINNKDMDILLSTGELQTVALLSMMLNEKGYKAVGLSGNQAGIVSNSEFGNAKIDSIYPNNILYNLDKDYIVVVAGFQASDKLGNTTTLGRGGSDLTAVALASVLKASRCEIYTDVDGIYTSDPRVISKAKLLKKVSYNEMLEAASKGAKVLHNRCVNLGKKYNIDLKVKNTFSTSRGSSVTDTLEDFNIKFISSIDKISRISIIGNMILQNKEILSDIFNIAKDNSIEILNITSSELSIDIYVKSEICNNFKNLLHDKLIKI